MTSATACAIRVASREQPRRQHPPVQLELEVGDHGDQVGVAGALAVAVDACPARGWRPASTAASVLATAQPVSLWQWMPTRTPVVSTHVVHDVGDPGRQHPAVGVAQRDDLGARVVRRAEHLERVGAVGAVAVEEVLGVEEDLPAPRRAGARRCRGPSRGSPPAWCAGPARRAGRATWRPASRRRRRCRAAPRPAGRRPPSTPARRVAPKAASLACCRSSSSARAAEELGVLGVGARPAALDVAHAELVEVAGDRQLVGDGEVEPLLLGAVAQGGVVDVERRRGGPSVFLLRSVGSGRATKNLSWVREVGASSVARRASK